MQKHFIRIFSLVIIIFSISTAASAQIYVKILPPVPVIVRPPQPSNLHVWVDEEWEPSGRSYRYSGGHWVTAPHAGYTRRPGHWKHGKRGHVWVPGHWRKGR